MTPNSAIPAIRRLVAMGLRMKVSEKFTAYPLYPDSPLAPLPAAAAAAPSAVPHHHFAAGREAQLPFGDYCLADRQALADHHILFHASSGDDRPRFHRLILLDDVYKGAGLAGLDGFIGHHHGILLGSQPQRYAHELAGPEFVV